MAASSRAAKSSVIQSVRDYVSRMASDVSGMKVLVMDAETTGIVSMVYTQTQILQHEVFLIDSIERARADKMAHLKAIYFVRPTHENVRLLQEEFKEPKYGEYHIFFSNTTRDTMIQQLAEADEHEVVQQVQEYYADFLAINPELASLGVPSTAGLTEAARWDQPAFDRIQQGVCALLLALKKRPVIRYTSRSESAMRLAESVLNTMDTEADLFAFRKPDVPPLLLLLDRGDDPVTPLLNQWTYQAMVHELIGISNNRVDLRGRPGVPKDLEQVVLSPEQDHFFAQNMFLNYGDLAVQVKELMDQFQAKTKSSKDISSIADMQNFVESYPEFRKLSGDVTKHVTLLGEINRIIDAQSLMECSEIEQELACNEDHSSAVTEVEALLLKDSVTLLNKVRLVLLYSLRYEREPSNRISKFTDLLGQSGATPEQQQLVSMILQHHGATQRTGDVFGNRSMLTAMKKSLQRSVKGVQNVYTQHQPYLAQQLEQLTKGTLSEAGYPYLGSELPPTQKRRAPTEVIVVILGGATYEEAKVVGEMNAANPGVRITLCGTTIHNCESYLDEISKLSGVAPPGGREAGGSAAGAQWTSTLSNLASNAPNVPGVDRKRIAALTSSVSSTLSTGVNQAMSKLQ